MKATLVALATTALLLGPSSFVAAQTQGQTTGSTGKWRYAPPARQVQANGRCGGVSYGTGARRCNTLSGGPSGGRSSGN